MGETANSKQQLICFCSNLEMIREMNRMFALMVVRNAAPVTCNAVESNMAMKQPIVLTLRSIDHVHLSPSVNQLEYTEN